MKRQANPQLSSAGELILALYGQALCKQEDLTPASVCNYLSDIRSFVVWYEAREAEYASDAEENSGFDPQAITTPTLTCYRTHLQMIQRQKPASVNYSLTSLKRYFGWASHNNLITYDPSTAIKLVGQEDTTPRHLHDREEQALVASVTRGRSLRDHTLIVLFLHTGLRAREICQLRRDQVKLGKRGGFLEIIGKRNKYREGPLNAKAHKVLEEYLPTLLSATVFLFPSSKTMRTFSERVLGYIVKKYAASAKLADVSPHDLRHRFSYRMGLNSFRYTDWRKS